MKMFVGLVVLAVSTVAFASDEVPRGHYFYDANWKAVEKIKVGMTRERVRKSCGGTENSPSSGTLAEQLARDVDPFVAMANEDWASRFERTYDVYYSEKTNEMITVRYDRALKVDRVWRQPIPNSREAMRGSAATHT